VTIKGSTTVDSMSHEMAQPTVNDRPEQEARKAGVKQEGQQGQQCQASAAGQPSQCSAPGRKPLFRT
jgi:hypothetical protein